MVEITGEAAGVDQEFRRLAGAAGVGEEARLADGEPGDRRGAVPAGQGEGALLPVEGEVGVRAPRAAADGLEDDGVPGEDLDHEASLGGRSVFQVVRRGLRFQVVEGADFLEGERVVVPRVPFERLASQGGPVHAARPGRLEQALPLRLHRCAELRSDPEDEEQEHGDPRALPGEGPPGRGRGNRRHRPSLSSTWRSDQYLVGVGTVRKGSLPLSFLMIATLMLVLAVAAGDAETLRKIAAVDGADLPKMKALSAELADPILRADVEKLLPEWGAAAQRHVRDGALLAEVRRLGGKAALEVQAPVWLRSAAGDESLESFARITELELNERTDGHKEPTSKALSDRVTDDWLARIADQTGLRRLELSGTAVTSAGLVHLKNLVNLEVLNVCLTAIDDRGFEHLAGLTAMKRLVICSSKITGTGFAHLQGLTQLESVNLHSSPASDAGLAEIGKRTSLRRLEIVHTKVTDAGLAHLAGLVNLRQLHVHGPETTAAALPFLSKLQELYQLDVYDKAASNETLEQIGKLPRLRLLMLSTGIFNDEGVKHLAGLAALEELTLDSDKVTDASVDTLGTLKSLRKLRLSRAKISAAGRERLRTLLPSAEILP